MMNSDKQKSLEAAGWKLGDASDFLQMSDDEIKLLDTRLRELRASKRQPKSDQGKRSGNAADYRLGSKIPNTTARSKRAKRTGGNQNPGRRSPRAS